MNRKRFAIKFADLKDQTTYNQINKVFGYLVDFPVKEFDNPGFTSTKAHLIFNWVLTIFGSTLGEVDKISILKDSIDDLITNESDNEMLKAILGQQGSQENVVVKEVIRYVSNQEPYDDIDVQIEKYLPIRYLGLTDEEKDTANQNNDFKDLVLDAYIKNKKNGNYQFSYIAYYMLFVSYLYKVIWLLRSIGNTAVITEIDTFVKSKLSNDLNFIFDLSGIKETDFCQNINSFVRCLHKNEIDEIVNFVQKRNHCAHPSGIIQYNSSEIENLIMKIDIYVGKIQNKINMELLIYIKGHLHNIYFNGSLILSEYEVMFLFSKRSEIINFKSDSEENITKKINYIKLVLNQYTENIIYEESDFISLINFLFDGFIPNKNPYYIIENDLIYIINKLSKNGKDTLVRLVNTLKINHDEKIECIELINNI